MNRHTTIRVALLVLLGAVAMQQVVDEVNAKEQSHHPPGASVEVPTRGELRFFAAPADLAYPDHIAVPVLGVDPRSLRDDFLGSRGDHVHHAIDIRAPRGTPVLAAVDGTVMRLLDHASGGKTIYLADRAGTTVYYYAHLDRYASIAEKQEVRRGEILGFVGTTGNAPPSAPHLHFGIDALVVPGKLRSGAAINPYAVLTARGVTYRLTGGEFLSARAAASGARP